MFENRIQNGLDLHSETRFKPSSEFAAELRLQRELENGVQTTDEFRTQSRIQVAVQDGGNKEVENASQN